MARLSMLINTLPGELEDAASFARAEGLGIEAAAFANHAALDEGLEGQIERHKKALMGIDQVVSHGPFHDLIATSGDPEIRAVCRKRHEQSLQAAREIGAKMYVAHSNYNPNIASPFFRTNFAIRMLDFWMPFVHQAAEDGITIVLENIWDHDPGIQREIVEKAGHPNLKASFDNGHALVSSKVPAVQWVETLGEQLGHAHLHDNDGKGDQHLSVGDGIEDWPALVKALVEHAPQALIVAESDTLEKNRASITALRRLLS